MAHDGSSLQIKNRSSAGSGANGSYPSGVSVNDILEESSIASGWIDSNYGDKGCQWTLAFVDSHGNYRIQTIEET